MDRETLKGCLMVYIGSRSGCADQYIYMVWDGEWTLAEQKHNKVAFWAAINPGASGDQCPNAFLIWFHGVSKLPWRVWSSAREAQASIALEQHAWELIITGLSVTALGFTLRGGLNYVYTKQGLGIAAAAALAKTKVKKTWGWAQVKENDVWIRLWDLNKP